jgi:beta-xylosidase
MQLSLVLLSYFVAVATATFSNPIIWEDFADLDIFRVDDMFYYSASNMHYSPGAPILRSNNLIDWEMAGHSIPVLDFGSDYYLDGGQAYVQGTWASSLRYRPSTSTYYWIGCIDFSKTYIYTASAVEGTWTQAAVIDSCYYDVGLLVASNDTMYAAYGSTNLYVSELSPDGLSEVASRVVYESDVGYIEGSRFYEKDGNFYILTVKPGSPSAEYVLKSTTGPWGPYTIQEMFSDAGSPVPGCSNPHQGGMVDTPNGDWYFMAFVDAYPGGRIPVLAPVEWDSDGWPSVKLVDGSWSTTYDTPNIAASATTSSFRADSTDKFIGSNLGPQWEWNHNPDNSKWSIDNGLTLQVASVTNDLYSAKNTLTHRIRGPKSSATIQFSTSSIKAGGRAGLALLRDSSAWIGIVNNDGETHVGVTTGMQMDSDWNTISTGEEIASVRFNGDQVWLRATADIEPTVATGQFAYSFDGITFTDLGGALGMNSSWEFFMGYRYGIFNFATTEIDGSITVSQFVMS